MVDIVETIWEDFESLLIENQNEKQTEIEECTKKCVHYNKQTIQKEGIQVCVDCGEIVKFRIFETCEWNNYKSDDGSTKNSSQRGDLYVSDNLKSGRIMVKDEDVCLHCGLCAERCPTGAWDMQKFLLSTVQAGPQCRDKQIGHAGRGVI